MFDNYLYYVAAIFLALIVYLLNYLKYFSKPEIEEKKIGPWSIFYKEYVGDYKKIGKIFQEIGKDQKKYFKFTKSFGFYYDNPAQVADVNKCRAVIGFILNPGEPVEKAELFKQQQKLYNHTELPMIKVCSVTFTHKIWLLFLLALRRAYSLLHGHMRRYPEVLKGNCFSIELYNLNITKPNYEFMFPISGPTESYMLSTYLPPDRAENKKSK